jgi:ABC-2 type transport system ATP-binding protein
MRSDRVVTDRQRFARMWTMLELLDLHKTYGRTRALDGLTLRVPPGSIHGFVGRNGAGKTTAMRITLGVLRADSGTVSWHGSPVDAATRRRIGYMPEERGLYPKMKVRDQLVYLARLHGMSAVEATASCDGLLDGLGVLERADDRVESLSLGNQQRVQLAAALVHDPDLLVLDEPFSGLDPVGVEVLAGALRRRVERGVPVLFSSHQLELLERICDAVTIIDAGRVVASGSVEELRGGGSRRLRVVVEGAPPDWASGLAGVTVVTAAGEVPTVLELGTGVSDQLVLDAARAAGVLREFTPVRANLTELFRTAVAA